MAPPGKRLSLTSPARPRQSKNTSFQASGTKRYNNQSSPRRSLCSTNQFEALSEDDEDTPPDSEMLEQQEDLVRRRLNHATTIAPWPFQPRPTTRLNLLLLHAEVNPNLQKMITWTRRWTH
jgi:hypothetical protein